MAGEGVEERIEEARSGYKRFEARMDFFENIFTDVLSRIPVMRGNVRFAGITAAVLCVGFEATDRLAEIRDAIREAKTQDE